MDDYAQLPEFDDHELVTLRHDPKTGLKAVVAIHNTHLGPATGGTRYQTYPNETEAVRDALKLSRAMSYKCALAGVAHGGGKGVIIANSQFPKTEAYLRAYADFINTFDGRFTTGEDVGITHEDIEILRVHSRFVNGRAGDLGPWAALGVFHAMRAALETVFGSPSFAGRTVAVKGLGKVGRELCRLLHEAGAKTVIGADIDPKAIERAKDIVPRIEIVPVDRIMQEPVHIFAPCALDGDLTVDAVRTLRAAVVCGGANNQLGSPEAGRALHNAGILYIPDYLANAGGLIQVAGELRTGEYDESWVRQKVTDIADTVRRIIALAKQKNLPPSDVADSEARAIIFGRV